MTLVALRQAVVDSIDAAYGPEGTSPAFNTVQTHGGRFNAAELRRLSVKAPAALIAILGGPVERQTGAGDVVGNTALVVFILTRGQSETKRDADALMLTEAVIGLMARNDWDYDCAQAPMQMAFANLYNGVIDRVGFALWSVGWAQKTDIAVIDTSDQATWPIFEGGPVYWDLAPKDGVIDMEDFISLNGEFMSAFGQIYVSTPAATSIAQADTYQKVAGTTTLQTSPAAVDCDMPVTNRIRHIGTATKPFLVGANCGVSVSGDASVTLALAKGGTVDEKTAITEDITLAGGAKTMPVNGTFGLDEDEYVELWVKADSTINVTVNEMTMIAAAT